MTDAEPLSTQDQEFMAAVEKGLQRALDSVHRSDELLLKIVGLAQMTALGFDEALVDGNGTVRDLHGRVYEVLKKALKGFKRSLDLFDEACVLCNVENQLGKRSDIVEALKIYEGVIKC